MIYLYIVSALVSTPSRPPETKLLPNILIHNPQNSKDWCAYRELLYLVVTSRFSAAKKGSS